MGGQWHVRRSSGNRAFDEYRTETLRRLEEEQREFREFLERLRLAKDKAEFDQFMAERRNRPAPYGPAANLTRPTPLTSTRTDAPPGKAGVALSRLRPAPVVRPTDRIAAASQFHAGR